jgi:pimeloyl-ACP methyl ester carboxylesterase
VAACDKRGVRESTGKWQDAGIVEQAADALATVEAVFALVGSELPIGLFGHSQGGWVVLEASRAASRVAFVATSSGPGVSPADQERNAARNLIARAGCSDAERDALLDHFALMLTLLRDGTPYTDAQAILDPLARELSVPVESVMYVPADASEWAFAASVIDYDPRPALRELSVPVLALFGELDFRVPVDASVEVFRELVAPGLLTVAILPGGEHRLQEGDPPEPVPGHLETLSSFIASVA